MPVILVRLDRVVPFVFALTVLGCAKEDTSTLSDSGSAAAVAANPEAVPKIVSIKCTINKSNPAQLVVDVGGEVPTGGWTKPTLAPRVHTTPPADGIWEFDFMALRPTGVVTQVFTPIASSHTWPDYPASTLKGVRVFGVGTGVKEAKLEECNRS